jgi:hypothetical protein
MAYELTFQPGQLTALNVDSLQQVATGVSDWLYGSLFVALHPSPSGGVLLVTNSAIILVP